MRKSPFLLAAFFVAVTIARVAYFMADGLALGWMGWGIAVGLAMGVYVASFYLNYRESWGWAFALLCLFVPFDLAFNELEMMRLLSIGQFLPPTANFLGNDAADLKWAWQWAGLAAGAIPTFAAAGLGALQASVNKIGTIQTRSWTGKIGLAIAAQFNRVFPEKADTVVLEGEEAPKIAPRASGRQGKARWEQLSAEQKVALPALTDGQIIGLYGGSPRRARQWKERIRKGE